MSRIEVLETERLLIREIDYNDFDAIHRIN